MGVFARAGGGGYTRGDKLVGGTTRAGLCESEFWGVFDLIAWRGRVEEMVESS